MNNFDPLVLIIDSSKKNPYCLKIESSPNNKCGKPVEVSMCRGAQRQGQGSHCPRTAT